MTPAATRLSLQTFCGDLAPDGAWRPDLAYVVRPYCGGWMEACAMYRDWVRTLPGFDHPPARPAWMRDAPVALIYPVQGEGLDHGPMAPNGYFPFANVLPHVARYAARLDSRILALLMHWEGTAPWAPPYLWPPLGGEEGLAALRDALHRDGHLLGLYGSGTAWTQRSMINDSREGSGAAFGRPVPGVPFVFHEWMCNFSGNQGGHMCDPFYRWTRAFHCGDMMALVLGRDGRLATAWGVPWDEAAVADEEALVCRVRDFNTLRRRHPGFLLEGRMILPFVACASSATRIEEAGRTSR